jgi:hypothetical protein
MDVDLSESGKSKKKVSWTEQESPKKPKEQAKAPATKSATETFTDLFWHMANIHPQVRLQATTTLVETLVNLEKEGKKSVQTKNGFTNISEELDYTLSRLAKGLLSNRDAARQGFATALSEVLRYLNVDLKEASDLIVAEVVNARSNPDVRPKERRIGFLFAVGAFVRSGRLPSALAKPATQNATFTFVLNFLKELVSAESLKQVQMLELTTETILELLAVIPKAQFQSHIHPLFSKILAVPSEGLQPELISLALGLQKMFGYSLSTDNPQLWNKSETIFGAKNIRNLTLPLNVTVRTVPRVHKVWDHLMGALSVPSATQAADLQRFGSVILDSLLKSDSIDHIYLAFQVVTHFLKRSDASLIEAVLTPELLNALFVTIPKSKSVLFGAAKTLVLTAIEQGKKSTNIALCILRRLAGPYGDLTVLDHHVKPAIMHTLIQTLDEAALTEYATFIFRQLVSAEAPSDLVTRTEEVSTFEPSASEKPSKASKKSTDMDVDEEDIPAPNHQVELREVVINPETWKKSRQEALAQHVLKMATWTQAAHVNVARKLLCTLYLLAFYNKRTNESATPSKTSKKTKSSKSTLTPVAESVLLLEKVDIDDQFSKYLSNVLLNLIDALKMPKTEESPDASNSEQKKPTRHSRSVDTTPFDHAHFWVLPLVQFEKSLLDDSANFEPRLHGNELDDIRSTAESLMAKIEPVLKVSDQTRRVRLEAFQALLIHLHVLINVDLEDSIQSIQDLSQVFEELFIENDSKKSKSKTPTKSKSSADMDVEKKPEAIEVFVEILIALLMKAHRTLKSVIEQNWVAFASLISDRAFDVLLNALEEEQSTEDDDDEDEDILELQEANDDDSSLDDLNSDEMAELGLSLGKTGKKASKTASKADSDSEDSDGNSDAGSSDGEEGDVSSSSDSEESNEVLDELARQKFKAVLEAAGAYAGSDDESEEVDLTDEKMFELDMGLAKVVKELQAAKNASKRSRENKMTPLEVQASEFRMRLLALVDLYVDHQSGHHHPAVEASPAPAKSPKAGSSSTAPSHTSPYHTTYLNAIWPLVRVVDVISQKKSMKPLLTRVLASIHRLCKSKPSAAISEKQIEMLYGVLNHCYAGFNQPSKPQQVEMRLTLIMFLQKILIEEKGSKFKKMREGFHTALKAYADSSPTSVKSRSLYIDLYAQIIRRGPHLHLPLLVGVGDVLASSKEGPMRQALAITLFGTLTRGVVDADTASRELQRSHNIPTVEFKALIKEFVSLFKILFTDDKGKAIHKKDLLVLAVDLFKTLLLLNKGDLAATQEAFDAKSLLKFTSSHLAANALPILTAAHETFTSYLQTGKGKSSAPKYASVEEKYAAKRQRKLERQQKQLENSKQSATKSKTADSSETAKPAKKEKSPKAAPSASAPKQATASKKAPKMDLSESVELEAPQKDRKRKEPSSRASLDDSAASSKPTKKNKSE